MDRGRNSFTRFLAGYCMFLMIALSLALFLPSISFTPVPLQAAISVDIVNVANSTVNKAEIRFRILDYENASRLRFFNITNSTFQVPSNTWIGPIADGSGFVLYVPEWPPNQHAQFMVDNISISPDFPANLSSLGYPPISYEAVNETLSFEYSAVLTITGDTFLGIQSIASLHQFTYNGFTQPVERRAQTMEWTKASIVALHSLVFLLPFSIWFPKTWRRLPFLTLALILLMVALYTFVGSGREIYARSPYPWNDFKLRIFGSLTHSSDDHLRGNLTAFIPLSMLMELWLDVKSGWRRVAVWYFFPILLAIILTFSSAGVGFSIAIEFLAWALWGLIIADRKTKTRLDLLLCLFSGFTAAVFFNWLFGYLPFIFSPQASTWWGLLARYHIYQGLVGAAIFALIALSSVKQKTISAIFGKDEDLSDEKSKEGKSQQKQPGSLSEGERMRRLQRLVSEISTRESSTLVFSTVTASASLAILILVLERVEAEWFGLAFWTGLLFSLMGFLYREATVFGIDIENHIEMDNIEASMLLTSSQGTSREFSRRTRSFIFLRMVIIRLFLLVPIGGWILVGAGVHAAEWAALTYFVLFGIAFSLSLLEYDKRSDP